MNVVNFVILGHGPPLWFTAVVWGGLALLVTVPSILGGFVGLSWPTAVRADREGGDTSSISPAAVAWFFVRAWAINFLLVAFGHVLFGTLSGAAVGAAVIGFALNVFLACASVRGRETASQHRREQTVSGDKGAPHD